MKPSNTPKKSRSTAQSGRCGISGILMAFLIYYLAFSRYQVGADLCWSKRYKARNI